MRLIICLALSTFTLAAGERVEELHNAARAGNLKRVQELIASGIPGGISKPVTSGNTASREPVDSVVITGNAQEAASSATFGNPSRCVGSTNTSIAL